MKFNKRAWSFGIVILLSYLSVLVFTASLDVSIDNEKLRVNEEASFLESSIDAVNFNFAKTLNVL